MVIDDLESHGTSGAAGTGTNVLVGADRTAAMSADGEVAEPAPTAPVAVVGHTVGRAGAAVAAAAAAHAAAVAEEEEAELSYW